MIRFSKRVLWILLIAVASFVPLLFPAAPISAQGNGALIHPDPPTLQVGQGQVEILNLVLENAKDVYGIDVRATFDPSVIEIADANPDQEGIQMRPGDFIKPDFAVRNTADNKAGTLMYVVTQTNPTPPANGKGIVLSIPIRGKVTGKQTTFTINFVDIADRRGIKLPIHTQSSTIMVVPPKPPTATPASNAAPTTAATPIISPTQAAKPTRTPAPSVAATTGGESNNLLLNVILIVVAVGACLGAVAVIALGAFLLLRRPRTGPNRMYRS